MHSLWPKISRILMHKPIFGQCNRLPGVFKPGLNHLAGKVFLIGYLQPIICRWCQVYSNGVELIGALPAVLTASPSADTFFWMRQPIKPCFSLLFLNKSTEWLFATGRLNFVWFCKNWPRFGPSMADFRE